MSKELQIIDLIAQLTGQTDALSDDAFWEPETRLIYTTDMLVENRHFKTAYFSPQDLGWKAAAVNISDIAAMGGKPRHLLISLGLPEALGLDWVRTFYAGLIEACQQFDCRIVGGDTVSHELITLNVTAVGVCPENHTVGLRANAEAGDYIIATGYHGLSATGLRALQQGSPGFPACKAAHLRPIPRVEAGLMLSRKFGRYALMDSSDGLADALIKIAQASGKRLLARQADIPVHPELLAGGQDADPQALWQSILYGGEDFELVATVPQVDDEVLTHFTVIGRVEEATDEQPNAWLEPVQGGQPQLLTLNRTYQHFSPQPEKPVEEAPHA